ncbi:hypothetical protein IFM89_034401 [Coptis chinensis]|uniref:Cytochrome P450 n=1 Tax=Coptis chinensis TaxID=261450 RepID=A0A835ME80_9MAGN|nr:hypothetical protein IFM89_034401 [Coptis chinensis]
MINTAGAAQVIYTMKVLSMHPDLQEKAREDVLQVFGRKAPDFDGLNHLKIVAMILYEVLRLYPLIVLLIRGTNKKMKLGEVILPPGTEIALQTLLVHRDLGLWGEDVKEFNSERFSGGVSKATRICLGQSFALIESKML